MSKSNLATEFPAPGLRNPFRYITGHNSQGDAVFLQVNRAFYSNYRIVYLSDVARRTMVIIMALC